MNTRPGNDSFKQVFLCVFFFFSCTVSLNEMERFQTDFPFEDGQVNEPTPTFQGFSYSAFTTTLRVTIGP